MNLNEKIIRFVKYSIKIINLVRKITIYMEIGTIKNIEVKIKNIYFSDHEGKVYGSESEYTYRTLIAEVENILTDLTTLVNNPEMFIRLSTYQERTNIQNELSRIYSSLESTNLYLYVEGMKIILRNYNVRDFSEHKIQLENIFRKNEELEHHIKRKQRNMIILHNEIQEELDSSKAQHTKILATLKEFSDEVLKQKSLNTDLSFIKKEANNNLQDINTYKAQVKIIKNRAETFAKSLQKEEDKLAEVENRIIANDKKLKEYEEERKRVLEEAKGLIESAKQALEYTTAQGLSAAFNSQYKEANNVDFLKTCIIGAVLCLGGALFLGLYFMQSINENNQWFIILGRILLLPIPIMGAIFCANSEQLKKNGKDEDNSEYVDYIRKALAEIHKDPLRNRNEEKQTLTNLKVKHLEQIVELAKKITELGKSGQ